MDADTVVDVINPSGKGRFLLVCEHAGRRIPPALGTLGLEPALLDSHIAWDPGAFPVASLMAEVLDAPLVASSVSRLVYDCNRPPEAPDAIPEMSEVHAIPGNRDLSPEERERRVRAVYHPFRNRLEAVLDGFGAVSPVLLTIHSFTPVFKGARRAVELGILHDADSRYADRLLDALSADRFTVRRNEPYGPQHGVTHTLREHALPRRLLNGMIEIRNDLIASPEDQRAMAALLAARATQALAAPDHKD